jgi:3-oxoacyl-[acyl-carrier-protein] synthase-3
LINTGIYRFKNTGEPAVAALIQKKISANPYEIISSANSHDRSKTTFSFDLNNGGCGWLTGIQIIDGFIQTGEINYGMVVTGDSEPFKGLSENYNFEPAAAAVILSRSEGSTGFSVFRSYSFPEHKEELISKTYYGKMKGKWGERNILCINKKETYLDSCVNCAEQSLNKFLDETGIQLKEIDLIIASQSPAGFISAMKNRTGIDDRFVDITKTGSKEFHTAGPAIALKKAWQENRFKTSKTIIFLTVGSGITVNVGLYRNS